jgi:hypothetical protein
MKMKKTWVVSVALAAVCLLGLGGISARAQETSKFEFSADYSYMAHSLTNGYCGGYGDFIECEDPGLQGFKLAGAWNANSHVGIQCAVSYHAGTHTVLGYSEPGEDYQYDYREANDVTTFTCGPKLTERVGDFELFGTLGAGGMHAFQQFSEFESDSEDPTTYVASAKGTIFGLVAGGGVDWVHKHWGLRLLEVDYVRGEGTLTGHCQVDCNTGGDFFTGVARANDLEIAMGVNFRFGSTK